jgi:hypothetical protein
MTNLWKFKQVIEEGDAELRFEILEDRGDRVLARATIFRDWPIPPLSVIAKADLEPA